MPRFKEKDAFNPELFLDGPGVAKQVINFAKSQILYSQGELSSSIFYIKSGTVKLSATNEDGKEAVITILEAGDFLGEACLSGASFELASTAMAMEAITVLVIQKKEMLRVLSEEDAFRGYFLSYVLRRNSTIQARLVDQLLNSSEKRLARALLLLAQHDKEEPGKTKVPNIPQETLAELIGTTRSRVNLFMNKFRKQGFIDYSRGTLRVHDSIFRGVLQR